MSLCAAALRVQVADPAGDMIEYLLTCELKAKHDAGHTGTLTTAGGGFLVHEWPCVPGSAAQSANSTPPDGA